MNDDTTVFLACTWQKSGNIDQSNQRNVKGIAETNKTSTFSRSTAIQYTGQHFWLIGYNTNRLSIKTGKTDDQVLGIIAVNFKKFTIVHYTANHFKHIVRFGRAIRNDVIQDVIQTVDGIGAFVSWGFF